MKMVLVSASCARVEGFMNTLFTHYPQPPMKYSNIHQIQQTERHKFLLLDVQYGHRCRQGSP